MREHSQCAVTVTTEDSDQLESVEEMYFKTRDWGKDKEDDYSDSNSSSDDKGNDADQDEAVENMEIYKMECSKSRENRLWFEMAQVQVIGSHLYFA